MILIPETSQWTYNGWVAGPQVKNYRYKQFLIKNEETLNKLYSEGVFSSDRDFSLDMVSTIKNKLTNRAICLIYRTFTQPDQCYVVHEIVPSSSETLIKIALIQGKTLGSFSEPRGQWVILSSPSTQKPEDLKIVEAEQP